jgi:IS5 family transposase
MDSFFLMGAKPLVQDSPTMKLHELLDWVEISHKLKGLYKRETTHGGGPEPYAPLAMFKLMLLGQWHGLSDAQLEHALKVGGLKSEMQHPTWIAMSVDCGLSLFGYPLHEVAEGLNGAAPVEGLAGSIVQQV